MGPERLVKVVGTRQGRGSGVGHRGGGGAREVGVGSPWKRFSPCMSDPKTFPQNKA